MVKSSTMALIKWPFEQIHRKLLVLCNSGMNKEIAHGSTNKDSCTRNVNVTRITIATGVVLTNEIGSRRKTADLHSREDWLVTRALLSALWLQLVPRQQLDLSVADSDWNGRKVKAIHANWWRKAFSPLLLVLRAQHFFIIRYNYCLVVFHSVIFYFHSPCKGDQREAMRIYLTRIFK